MTRQRVADSSKSPMGGELAEVKFKNPSYCLTRTVVEKLIKINDQLHSFCFFVDFLYACSYGFINQFIFNSVSLIGRDIVILIW